MINPVTADVLPRMTLRIRGDGIQSITPDAPLKPNHKSRVIDLTGCTVLPGFVDTHAHVTVLPMLSDGRLGQRMDRALSERALRIMLAHGVTTVRNPAAPALDGVALRKGVDEGKIIGPSLVTAGEALNRRRKMNGPFVSTFTEKEVRQAVRRQALIGVDCIKVYGAMPPALVMAAVEEAHGRGLTVLGHLGRTNWTEAARLGVDTICHAAPWSRAYLPKNRRKAYRRSMRGRLDWLDWVDMEGPSIRKMIATMARRHVTVEPTLIAFYTKFWGNHPACRAHPDLALVAPPLLAMWRRGGFTADWTPKDFARGRALWGKLLSLTRAMHEAGIVITAGTDYPNPWVVPGASFHRELEILVEAGLSPMDVLRIATWNGAYALGRHGRIGAVAAGWDADLVVLDANPLKDIRNTRRIRLVIRRGKLYRPAVLRR